MCIRPGAWGSVAGRFFQLDACQHSAHGRSIAESAGHLANPCQAPKALRQQLGLARGSRVSFVLVGDHIEVRPFRAPHPRPASGFGMLQSQRPPVPVDFDPASLLRP
jgi:hypothetical protein